MEEKEHLVPVLPQILDNLDPILENLDLLEPCFGKIAPHAHKLLPHLEQLTPHLDKLIVHLDAVLLFLDCEGWERVLPYLEPICRHLDAIAPHAPALVPYFDDIVQDLPLYTAHLDTVAPVLDNMVPRLGKLLGAASYAPSMLQNIALSSKVACKSLPATARLVPPCMEKRSEPKRLDGGSSSFVAAWIPKSPVFMVPSFEKRVLADNRVVVYFLVVLKDCSGKTIGSRLFRYSELRLLHKRIYRSLAISGAPLPDVVFPPKVLFNLHGKILEKRRTGLDLYLQFLAKEHSCLLQVEVYRCFVQSLFVQGILKDSRGCA